MAVTMGGCATTGPADPTPPASSALFDSFEYVGKDDVYVSLPLPDKSSYYNPILPGWYSDPTICTNGEGDYYLATSTFTFFPGVPLFHSRDLINWTFVRHILDRESQLVNMKGQGVSGGIFAPDLKYNPANKTYYMVTTNVGYGNFLVKTTNPAGTWSDPIRLDEVGGIDPSIFFDDDGKAYILNNDEAPDNKPEYDGHRTIRIQEYDLQNDRTVGPRKILVNKGAHPADNPIWIEGPHMYKINGKYFLMSAEGGTGTGHSEVIFRSNSPWGPFTPWKGNPILTQRHLDPKRANPVTCAGHADLLQAADSTWWAVFLACRPHAGNYETLGRETFLMPVRWSEDGFPYITSGDETIPVVGRKAGAERVDSLATFGNFSVTDQFTSGTLTPQWSTLRGPAQDNYSLSTYPGYLCLNCSQITARQKDMPSMVSRRLQHHKFESSTRVIFNPENETDAAGIVLFKDEAHHYFMGINRNGKGRCITLWKSNGSSCEPIAESMIDDTDIALNLKVCSEGTDYSFLYKTDDAKEWTSLAKGIDSYYLSTANAGGFTGTMVGLYATKKTGDSENLAYRNM